MKKLISLSKNFLVLFFSGLIIILFNSCQDSFQEEIDLQDSISNEEIVPWNKLLNQLDLESEMLFVQQGESIQKAIDAALPGNTIYIEPGNYQEKISMNRPDINLIGLSLEPDDLTINNGIEKTIDILNLYEENSPKSFNHGRRSMIRNFSRTELERGIAHYQFEVVMGNGEFDVVRIHRVVRERRPYRPVRTKGDVFMIHGAIQDFDDIFFTAGAETINTKTSSPIYLAANNIDVWGIDMGWTMVPLETTDFSFMQGWGMEKDVDHALKAMSIARLIRGLSRQGFSRMNLLGFSYGVHVAYGAADRETQQHWFRRDVKGLIPVESALKYEDVNLQNNACTAAGNKKDKLNNGQYHHPWGVNFITWGNLALTAPDDQSPFHPALTNSQFLRFVGSQGFFAGNVDEFFYTDPLRFFRLSANLAPYWPMQINYELSAVGCPTEDVSYDDHLGEITLPILYIGAEIATGETGMYTSTLTTSTDITNHIVPGYSHADLWFAYDADHLVWSTLRQWLVDHR